VLGRGERVGVLASYSSPYGDGETNFATNRALVLAVTSLTGTGQDSGGDGTQTLVAGNIQVRLALTPTEAEKVVNASEFGKVLLSRQGKGAEVDRQLVDPEDVLK
jgi:hypothetical protein